MIAIGAIFRRYAPVRLNLIWSTYWSWRRHICQACHLILTLYYYFFNHLSIAKCVCLYFSTIFFFGFHSNYNFFCYNFRLYSSYRKNRSCWQDWCSHIILNKRWCGRLLWSKTMFIKQCCVTLSSWTGKSSRRST